MQLYLNPFGSLVAQEECWRTAIEAEQGIRSKRHSETGRAAKSTENWLHGKVPDVGFPPKPDDESVDNIINLGMVAASCKKRAFSDASV
jgi:hypothetical protein